MGVYGARQGLAGIYLSEHHNELFRADGTGSSVSPVPAGTNVCDVVGVSDSLSAAVFRLSIIDYRTAQD